MACVYVYSISALSDVTYSFVGLLIVLWLGVGSISFCCGQS
jgi:hypothetical protein